MSTGPLNSDLRAGAPPPQSQAPGQSQAYQYRYSHHQQQSFQAQGPQQQQLPSQSLQSAGRYQAPPQHVPQYVQRPAQPATQLQTHLQSQPQQQTRHLQPQMYHAQQPFRAHSGVAPQVTGSVPASTMAAPVPPSVPPSLPRAGYGYGPIPGHDPVPLPFETSGIGAPPKDGPAAARYPSQVAPSSAASQQIVPGAQQNSYRPRHEPSQHYPPQSLQRRSREDPYPEQRREQDRERASREQQEQRQKHGALQHQQELLKGPPQQQMTGQHLRQQGQQVFSSGNVPPSGSSSLLALRPPVPSVSAGMSRPPKPYEIKGDVASMENTVARASENIWLRIGGLSQSMGLGDKALYAFEKAVQINPSSVLALTNVGAIYARQGRCERAAELLQQAIRTDPAHGEAWGVLAHCYLMRSDLTNAFEAYKRAVATDKSRDPCIWFGMGILYEQYGGLDQAVEAFNACLQINPQFERANEVYYMMGTIFKEQKNVHESMTWFNKLLLSTSPPPSSALVANTYNQVGKLYEMSNEIDTAIEMYRRSVSEDPAHAQSLQILGWLLHQKGHTDDAISLLVRSTAADPLDGQSWYLLGRAHMALSHYREAYEAYQKAVLNDSSNPTFWCSIGVLYYQMQQYGDAMDAYSRAIHLNPNVSEVWYDLGTLYESCSQFSDAIVAYDRAAELNPGSASIAERLRVLRSGESAMMQKQGVTASHRMPPVQRLLTSTVTMGTHAFHQQPSATKPVQAAVAHPHPLVSTSTVGYSAHDGLRQGGIPRPPQAATPVNTQHPNAHLISSSVSLSHETQTGPAAANGIRHPPQYSKPPEHEQRPPYRAEPPKQPVPGQAQGLVQGPAHYSTQMAYKVPTAQQDHQRPLPALNSSHHPGGQEVHRNLLQQEGKYMGPQEVHESARYTQPNARVGPEAQREGENLVRESESLARPQERPQERSPRLPPMIPSRIRSATPPYQPVPAGNGKNDEARDVRSGQAMADRDQNDREGQIDGSRSDLGRPPYPMSPMSHKMADMPKGPPPSRSTLSLPQEEAGKGVGAPNAVVRNLTDNAAQGGRGRFENGAEQTRNEVHRVASVVEPVHSAAMQTTHIDFKAGRRIESRDLTRSDSTELSPKSTTQGMSASDVLLSLSAQTPTKSRHADVKYARPMPSAPAFPPPPPPRKAKGDPLTKRPRTRDSPDQSLQQAMANGERLANRPRKREYSGIDKENSASKRSRTDEGVDHNELPHKSMDQDSRAKSSDSDRQKSDGMEDVALNSNRTLVQESEDASRSVKNREGAGFASGKRSGPSVGTSPGDGSPTLINRTSESRTKSLERSSSQSKGPESMSLPCLRSVQVPDAKVGGKSMARLK